MVSMLTILPALLTVTGRRAFWPFIPRSAPMARMRRTAAGAGSPTGSVAARGGSGSAPTAVLAVMIAGLAFLNSDLTSGNGFRNDVDSVQGQELLEAGFAAGANAPTDVLVPDESRLGATRAAAAEAPGVAEVSPQEERGPTGTKLELTLEEDPYSTAAFDLSRGSECGQGGRRRRRAGRRPDRRGVRPAPVRGPRQPADRPDRSGRRLRSSPPGRARCSRRWS